MLRGVDAEFSPGTITVIEGANGVGKTTLLSVIGGVLEPSNGSVRWEPEGYDVSKRRDRVGWVGHESNCYRDLTALENVELVSRVYGTRTADVASCLERVGASGFRDRRVGLLSRGQKQRVSLARALVHRPSLLLFDEPFTGLDPAGTALLESVLVDERERGVIAVVISHDTSLAARLDAKRLLLTRGRVQLASSLS